MYVRDKISNLIRLVSVFIAALVTANFTSAKIASLPEIASGVVSSSLLYPTGIVAYAVTYLVTDSVNEVYGEDVAKKIVKSGFVALIIAQLLAFITVKSSGTPAGIPPKFHNAVFSSSANIVIGSLFAYYVSQNVDVKLYQKFKTITSGDHLWFRNTASTSISELIDAVLFSAVAFIIAPMVLGFGTQLSISAVAATLPAQYTLKFLCAVGDTPFVYAIKSTITNDG